MDRKFLKWCKKLIPGKSTVTNSRRDRQENITECSVNSQESNPTLYQNVCSEMQEELLAEGQGKTEENLDLSTDGCALNKSKTLSSEMNISWRTQDFDANKETMKSLGISVKDTYESDDLCGAVSVAEDKVSSNVEFLESEMECLKTLKENFNCSLSENEMLIIRNEVEIQLNKICPLEFYDFCLITCDPDYEEASLFRSNLCREYNLKGCMLFDPSISNLGGDIFLQYEAMIERSTKVFFYHTENYNKDFVHLRIQNGAVYQQLWEKMRWDREKCVPVFPHGKQKLGLALSGVSGLDPTFPEILSRRVHTTFTANIRKIRVLKEIDSKQKRPLFYKDLLERILKEYVKRKLSVREQALGPHWKLKISDEEATELTHSESKMMLEQETKNEIIKAVTQTITSSNEGNSETENKNPVNIYKVKVSESSDIHVGPRIEVNIHVDTSSKSTQSKDSVNRTETM